MCNFALWHLVHLFFSIDIHVLFWIAGFTLAKRAILLGFISCLFSLESHAGLCYFCKVLTIHSFPSLVILFICPFFITSRTLYCSYRSQLSNSKKNSLSYRCHILVKLVKVVNWQGHCLLIDMLRDWDITISLSIYVYWSLLFLRLNYSVGPYS